MHPQVTVKRTTAADPDFRSLIAQLDRELWDELKEDQATYDQYNKVEQITTAVLVYVDDEPVASGCFKEFDPQTVEIKRMFVQKPHRGKGFSKTVLNELEKWAGELGCHFAVLETSIHFKAARQLYTSSGYNIIPNYGQYRDLPESVCMKKQFHQTAEAATM